MSDVKITKEDLLNKMKKGSNGNGNGKPKYTIEDLRQQDIEDTILEKIQGKGKMSIQDIMLLDWWERRQKQNDAPQQPQIDIEEIIRKSQEPLLKQIEEMKREQEEKERRREEQEKWDKIQSQIDSLKTLLTASPKDEKNPILEQIQALQNELKDEKEKARKKEEEHFQQTIKDMIYDLNDQIAALKASPDKSKDIIEQITELEAKKAQIAKAFGLKTGDKEDDASTLEVIDSIADKIPKWAKTASTVREVFSKDSEIPDDVPGDVPTTLPQRNTPTQHIDPIPQDIRDFLNRGYEKQGAFYDYTDTKWTNSDGVPITRKDLEDLSLTDPGMVRRLMRETEESWQKQQEAKKEQQKEKKPDVEIKHNESRVHTAPPPEKAEKLKEEAAKPESNPALEEAMKYIETGEDKQDANGNTVWVGKQNEIYSSDDGKPATKDDLKKMAQEDPEGFMDAVNEHLAQLSEGNGNQNTA